MFYDLLVVYLMKLSVNKFYNVMSMYVYNMSFSISWIKDHIKKTYCVCKLITLIIKVSAQMYHLAGYKEILVKRSIGYSFYKNLMFI